MIYDFNFFSNYLEKTLYIFSSKIKVGIKWKKRSNTSAGLLNVPFLSIINFSSTCGTGQKGARIMKTASTIRIQYGIFSRMAHIIFIREVL